ncbi:MAG TPA: hypothetical protein VFU48_11855, partial [Nitrospira sp.]|nr:hypothetical protein [Nitrospira sp.]
SIPNRLKCPGQVIRRQTTYWTVETAMGERWRIHFLDKVEFGFTQSSYSNLTLLDNHPLLTQYTEPWFELYFLGAPTPPDTVTSAVAGAVVEATEGWRRYEDYVNPAAPLSSGYGLLMRAPQTVIQSAETVLAKNGVKTKKIDCARVGHPYRILLFDKSFVIAEEFRFEPLEANKKS